MIKDRIIQLIEHKSIAKENFYKEIGVTSANFRGKARESDLKSETIVKILSVIKDVNTEWLLTGKGEMLKSDQPKATVANLGTGIPLIPIEAFAGAAANNGYSINADTIEDRYHIPLFEGKGVDFMIYVRGSSMYPKYSNGDIVACRFVKELLFIQWNKVYVIDSKSQGAMIKRLIKCETPEHITCRSDNKEYPDFDVPLADIQHIALVIGSVRLE